MTPIIKVERELLIGALRARYDHYSAEAVLDAACARAGVPAQPAYEPAQVAAIRAALARVGDRLAAVEERLDALLGGHAAAPAAAAAPVAVAAPAVPAAAPKEHAALAAAPEHAALAAGPEHAALAPAPHAPAQHVTLALAGVEVDDDTEVLVCGGLPALGDWDPERALRMERADHGWRVTFDAPSGAELAFKFLQRHPDGEVVWEGGANRTVPVAKRIEATWR